MGAIKLATYTVTVRGKGIHGFRRWLKAGWRSYGLKVIDAYEHTRTKVSRCSTAQAVRTAKTSQGRRESERKMDASKFAGSAFLGLDDVKDGKIRAEIAAAEEGKFGKLVLIFTNGLKFSLNVTNVTELIKAWGSETDDWVGEHVELYAGETLYEGKMVPSVRVTPLMRATGEEKKPPRPKPKSSPGGGDLNDEIPF
jgi:hypothetical protein